MKGPAPHGNRSPYAAVALYGVAGVQLAASVVAGLLVGDYLDGRLGTAPWLTAAGVCLGFIGGLANLVRIVRSIAAGGDGGGGG